MTSGGSSVNVLSVREWLGVLSILADTPEGATQRLVAEELAIPKIEARRRLRAAVSAGLVVETITTPWLSPAGACSRCAIQTDVKNSPASRRSSHDRPPQAQAPSTR